MNQTTTRYAIELEPGKWWNTERPAAVADFSDAEIRYRIGDDLLNACFMFYPHARIVRVKCEVQDE